MKEITKEKMKKYRKNVRKKNTMSKEKQDSFK